MTDVAAPGAPAELPALYASGRRKQQRARRLRVASYVIGLSLLLALVLFADWDSIADGYFNLDRMREQFPDIITVAARNTLLYTVMAYAGGVVVAIVLALLRLSPVRIYRAVSLTFVEILRGLPALVTIILIGLVVPTVTKYQWPKPFGLNGGGVLALALVSGAYMAETVRAGIEAVPRGQSEASRSLGLSPMQTMRWVVVPQAFRIVIPPLTNELVMLLKDTALLSVLGSTVDTKELLKFGQDVSASSFNGSALVLAAIIYLVMTVSLTWVARRLESRLRTFR